MSSKSAVKLVVPEGDDPRALQLGRDPHRLEERAEGRRLLPRRAAADRGRLPDLDAASSPGSCSPRWSSVLAAHARRARQARREGQVQADVLQQPRRQRAGRRADLPLRLARRLVRRRPAGLPARRSSAGASGRSGAFLAIWVIGYGGVQAVAPRFIRGRDGGEPDGRTATWLAFVLGRRPGRHRDRASPPDVDPTVVIVVGLIVFGVRLRAQLGGALLPDPRLRRERQGGDERRLLLHGQRRRTPRRHGALRRCSTSGGGLEACLWASVAFVVAAGLISLFLPRPRL